MTWRDIVVLALLFNLILLHFNVLDETMQGFLDIIFRHQLMWLSNGGTIIRLKGERLNLGTR